MIPLRYYIDCFHKVRFVLSIPFLSLFTSTQIFAEPIKAGFITKFPFTLTNRGIVIIKGQLGNYPDTLNFILDTGCSGISLDSATAKHFNLTATRSDATIKGIAQKKSAEFIQDQQLRLPGLEVNDLKFHINDYRFLSEANNVKIAGLIGLSLLKYYTVKLNYDDLTIEVWKPNTIAYAKEGYSIPIDVNKLAAMNATVNDNREVDAKFYFDTGAEMCFLLSEKFINDSNVLSDRKKITVTRGEGLGGKKDMMITTMNEVRVGPYMLKNVPAYIFDDPNNVADYPLTAGIIGNELMQRFNVVIDFPANQILLTPNRQFNNPFNYAYTGCAFAVANGKLVINDVIKDSPAEIAGLQKDDIIFGINDNFKNNIDQYNSLLSKAGSKVRIYVLRKDQVKSTVVEIQSIL